MNNQRAKEIISSPVMVNVMYNDSKIYMENLNENNQTCTIHYLHKTEKKLDVPLSSLIEQ